MRSRWRLVVLGLALVGVVHLCWPISDSDRREARTAAVRLLAADVSVGRMPADLTERTREFKSGADARRAVLTQTWIPGVAQFKARDWEDSVRYFLTDATYDGYVDNRYRVTDWRSVRRIPGGFFVSFRGHMEYRDAESGAWVGSPAGTEHLTLTHIGGWRLINELLTDYNPS